MCAIRKPKDETHEEILDVAAGLLASHGIKGTSMQTLAAATGYSKAAMFARFGNKDHLISLVVDHCVSLGQQALAVAATAETGPERDRVAIEALTNIGLARPGFIALVVASVTTLHDEALDTMLRPVGDALFQMFDLPTPPAPMHVERGLSVTGSLAALSILVLNYSAFTNQATARKHIARIAGAPLATFTRTA